ncbi:hypothetical protein HanXRQr2_Chr10g0440031 [Helianthus annuus]|uniref:Uncharacterized protein n=1 Tax=Helianthus annuus TaxID=4232 RepID=A0A9K3N468_HELAN|nr:hypothetical protein HanXRQr2_Chr10g0440031 [Helianthus annuus]
MTIQGGCSSFFRLVGMGRLIPMRIGHHVGVTSPSYGGWASSIFEGVDDGATPHKFLLFNLFICLTFIV